MAYKLLLQGRDVQWLCNDGTGGAVVEVSNFGAAKYASRYAEASATVAYAGAAEPGSATSAASWQIQRLTFSGNDVVVEFADGDADFDNVWDNRASLSYS